MVTFSPVAVVSVKPEEDRLVIVPTDPPAAGLLLAAGVAEALLAAGVAGALLAAGVAGALLLQAATVAITAAAAAAAMTLLWLLENMCLTPVVEILVLRYCRPRRKCCGKSLEGGREVVQRGLTAKAYANCPQGNAKVTGPARRRGKRSALLRFFRPPRAGNEPANAVIAITGPGYLIVEFISAPPVMRVLRHKQEILSRRALRRLLCRTSASASRVPSPRSPVGSAAAGSRPLTSRVLALRSGCGCLGDLCQREPQVEGCAAAGCGVDADLAAVGGGQ